MEWLSEGFSVLSGGILGLSGNFLGLAGPGRLACMSHCQEGLLDRDSLLFQAVR